MALAQILKPGVKAFFGLLGYEIRKKQRNLAGHSLHTDDPTHGLLVDWSVSRFLKECTKQNVDLVLDVGANSGQFGKKVRRLGYSGRLVSFEPLSSAHTELARNAAGDSLWTVAPRAALGAYRGETEINISTNSYSSSLLPMLDKHLQAAPASAYAGREACLVITLDEYVETHFSDAQSLALKIDTQGYEEHVLRGAADILARVKVLILEMSLVPLYAGAPTVDGIMSFLNDRGIVCIGITPEFLNPWTGELLQVNALFARLPRR